MSDDTAARMAGNGRFLLAGREIRFDWGNVAVAVGLACFVGWYLTETVQASTALHNLLLILPLSIMLFGLLAAVLLLTVRVGAKGLPLAERNSIRLPIGWKIPVLMLWFGLYVATLPGLGFDVGSMLFCAACLITQGERRLLGLAGFSILFGLLIGFAMSSGVVPDAPLLILNGMR